MFDAAPRRQGRAYHGAVTVRIVATSWNCAQYITPRYTSDEVRDIIQPLLHRVAELEGADDSADPEWGSR